MTVNGQHGWSVTFGTQGGTYKLTEVGDIKITRSEIDTVDHSTTGQRTAIFEKLTKPQPITLTYHHEPGSALPTFTTAETITLTLPVAGASGTAGYFSGTAAVVGVGTSSAVAGSTETQKATIDIQFDGVTDLAFTAQV